MIQIIKAKIEDAKLIQQLAHAIWYPTYSEILSKEQIDFMLDNLYCIETLESSIQGNTTFYILYEGNVAVGFIGFGPKEDVLKIDKIYLLPSTQGKGFGKMLIDLAAEEARNLGFKELELNVNRYKKAYKFYLKQAFKVVEEDEIPYYEFFLNDYVMRKSLIS
jgi:GNAT superfamily N-acetyltransferase